MPRRKRREGKKYRFVLIAVIACSVPILLVLLLLPRNKGERLEHEAPPFAHSLTDQEASRYFQREIIPILHSGASDPIPNIREIMRSLEALVREGKVEVGIASTYRGDSLAATHTAPDGRMLWITFSGPRLLDYQSVLRPSDFRDQVILAICHETLHLQYDPVFTEGLYRHKLGKQSMDRLRLKGETLVWGLTVQRVIRPMLRAKRSVPPEEAEVSQVFEKFGDNPKDPDWTQWVKDHRFAASR